MAHMEGRGQTLCWVLGPGPSHPQLFQERGGLPCPSHIPTPGSCKHVGDMARPVGLLVLRLIQTLVRLSPWWAAATSASRSVLLLAGVDRLPPACPGWEPELLGRASGHCAEASVGTICWPLALLSPALVTAAWHCPRRSACPGSFTDSPVAVQHDSAQSPPLNASVFWGSTDLLFIFPCARCLRGTHSTAG